MTPPPHPARKLVQLFLLPSSSQWLLKPPPLFSIEIVFKSEFWCRANYTSLSHSWSCLLGPGRYQLSVDNERTYQGDLGTEPGDTIRIFSVSFFFLFLFFSSLSYQQQNFRFASFYPSRFFFSLCPFKKIQCICPRTEDQRKYREKY